LWDCITYVGLDVHKDGIVVASAEGGLRGEVRDYCRIANTPAALQPLVHKLARTRKARTHKQRRQTPEHRLRSHAWIRDPQ